MSFWLRENRLVSNSYEKQVTVNPFKFRSSKYLHVKNQ